MLVSLPNGKTVDISFDDYLRIGMEDYRYLVSQNFGAEMEDPFFGSVLRYGSVRSAKNDEDDEEDDEQDNDTPDDSYPGIEYPYE